jgi:soluble lytic murein transglycosylase-like protein
MINSLMSRMNAANNLSVQQLHQAVADGTLPAYVGVPMIQDKMKQQQQAMASQKPQQQPPIADQIMQASAPRHMTRREVMPQEDQMQPVPQEQGIDTAQSNLPTQMAEGGIIGYANRGLVDDAADDAEALELAQLYGSGSDNDFVQAIMPAAGGSSVHPSAAIQMQPESKASAKSGHKYHDAVVEEAKRQGLDPDIAIHALYKETGGLKDPETARSKAGAIGVMQLMPKTAKGLGVDPTDPMQNIRGGVTYLKQMNDKYQDPHLTLMAYNAGPGRVDKALRSPQGLASLPAETRNYSQGGVAHFAGEGSSLVGPTGESMSEYLSNNPEIAPEKSAEKPLSKEAQAAKEALKRNAARSAAMNPSTATSSASAAPEMPGGIRGLAQRAIGNIGLPASIAYVGDKLGRASMNTMAGNSYFEDYSDPANGDLAVGNAILQQNPKAASMVNNPTGTTPAVPAPASNDKGIGALNTPAVPMTSPTYQEMGYDPSKVSAASEGSTGIDFNKYFSEKIKDLADQRAESKKDREMNKYLALMQAGFGMMGGTSPYAAVNIGQGAEKGIGAYAGLNKQSQDQMHDLAAEELGMYKYGSAAQNAAAERELKYGNKDQRLALGQATLEETKSKNAKAALAEYEKTQLANLKAKYPLGEMDKNYQAAAQSIYNNPVYKALQKSAFPELASIKSDTSSSSGNKKPISSFEQ